MVDALSSTFEPKGWLVRDWQFGDQVVTVLQREPFRLAWVATKLVTFVYVIRRTPRDYQSILDDYAALRDFADSHKQTRLPFALQCGYALLPLYIGALFSESLIADVRSIYKKRWCVLHVPSLLDSETERLHTLETKSLWGCVYRDFIRTTVADTALALTPSHRLS